ncbi:MAG TPA: hypothetical protein PK402_03155 [Tepidisphaeraceae bacterium]|nr:hypothetical protein [Tepidisphaeraceae bacterium]
MIVDPEIKTGHDSRSDEKEDTAFQGSVSSGGEKMRRCAKLHIKRSSLPNSLPKNSQIAQTTLAFSKSLSTFRDLTLDRSLIVWRRNKTPVIYTNDMHEGSQKSQFASRNLGHLNAA